MQTALQKPTIINTPVEPECFNICADSRAMSTQQNRAHVANQLAGFEGMHATDRILFITNRC